MGETKFFLTLQLRNMGMAFEISIIKTIAYCESSGLYWGQGVGRAGVQWTCGPRPCGLGDF